MYSISSFKALTTNLYSLQVEELSNSKGFFRKQYNVL